MGIFGEKDGCQERKGNSDNYSNHGYPNCAYNVREKTKLPLKRVPSTRKQEMHQGLMRQYGF